MAVFRVWGNTDQTPELTKRYKSRLVYLLLYLLGVVPLWAYLGFFFFSLAFGFLLSYVVFPRWSSEASGEHQSFLLIRADLCICCFICSVLFHCGLISDSLFFLSPWALFFHMWCSPVGLRRPRGNTSLFCLFYYIATVLDCCDADVYERLSLCNALHV